jgi:uncharacterized protein YjbI with pentapeptide repeats
MADPEHVEILKQGVEVWNRWRERFPRIQPDLRGADLSRMDLKGKMSGGIHLSTAMLWEANLCSTNLRFARLSGAELMSANLKMTDLRDAELIRANLSGAKLNMADLQLADLTGALLYGSDLNKTNLSWTKIGNTVFVNIDLSQAVGLDNVTHKGPSSIGIDTIYVSEGHIPEVFLRGCGAPEKFITYMKSLTMVPLDFYSCFISYSHKDKSFARRLHDQLQARGIRCWLDEHQMLPGDDIYEQVDRGIKLWDKVLLCCSEHSLTSWWVDNEVSTALEKEQQLQKELGKPVLAIIPLNLDGYLFDEKCAYPKAAQLRKRLAADFTGWEMDNAKFEEQFERVVKALQTESAREEAPVSKL